MSHSLLKAEYVLGLRFVSEVRRLQLTHVGDVSMSAGLSKDPNTLRVHRVLVCADFSIPMTSSQVPRRLPEIWHRRSARVLLPQSHWRWVARCIAESYKTWSQVKVPCRRVLETARSVAARDELLGIRTSDPVIKKLAKARETHSVARKQCCLIGCSVFFMFRVVQEP